VRTGAVSRLHDMKWIRQLSGAAGYIRLVWSVVLMVWSFKRGSRLQCCKMSLLISIIRDARSTRSRS
jgi:hypothetical protein